MLAQPMMLVPLALYLIIAVGARTCELEDFFVSGRRVPPVFNGFVLAAVAVGGVGFLAYTGTVFFLGFDALAIGLGWTFGMLLAAVLFVPYLRKAGSYTLPSFLGHRFRSRGLRMAASVMQLPPTALLLVAEIKIAALIAALFLPISFSIAVLVLVAALIAADRHSRRHAVGDLDGERGVPGRRGRLAVVVTTVSILLTNLPAPQLTYGEMFSSLHNAEITAGLTPVAARRARHRAAGSGAGADRQALPAAVRQSRADRFRRAVSLSRARHRGAAEPADAQRRDQLDRRSAPLDRLGPAVRGPVRDDRAGHRRLRQAHHLPRHRAGAGLRPARLAHRAAPTSICFRPATSTATGRSARPSCSSRRDGIALALPAAAGLPYVLIVLMATAALAIALAAAASHLFTLAASLAEDLYRVLDRRQALPRLIAAWAAIGATAAGRRRVPGDCRCRSAEGRADRLRLRRRDASSRRCCSPSGGGDCTKWGAMAAMTAALPS